MKASELRPGKTYVGRNGKRRFLHKMYWSIHGGRWARYDKPEGGTGACTIDTFARWAEREATPEESAP